MSKYYIWTIGCQMNKSESERVASVLDKLGLQSVADEKEADMIFVNACSVRQTAIDRIFGKGGDWNKDRESGKLKTLLFGCVLPLDRPKMTKFFDAHFDVKDIPRLVEVMEGAGIRISDDQKRNIQNMKWDVDASADYFHVTPKYESKVQAYVPIMTGCDHFCTYCAVPYTKGPEISRPAKDILNEVRTLVENGCKEITLLGQNVNSYGLVRPRWSMVDEPTKKLYPPESWVLDPSSKKPPFVQLLEAIDRIPGKFWVRFLTSHPMDMSLYLISAIANGKNLTEYIHLPAQAGNNQVLKKMNRQYTIEWYKEIVKNIRAKIPQAVISTDIIVGFPDETAEQFEETANLFDFSQYDIAYIAKYSPRPGTAATHFEDNIPQEEKKRREKVLTDKLAHIALARNQPLLGKNVEVLVESANNGVGFGHTREFRSIKFPFQGPVGQFVNVQVNHAESWGLKGTVAQPI